MCVRVRVCACAHLYTIICVYVCACTQIILPQHPKEAYKDAYVRVNLFAYMLASEVHVSVAHGYARQRNTGEHQKTFLCIHVYENVSMHTREHQKTFLCIIHVNIRKRLTFLCIHVHTRKKKKTGIQPRQ